MYVVNNPVEKRLYLEIYYLAGETEITFDILYMLLPTHIINFTHTYIVSVHI